MESPSIQSNLFPFIPYLILILICFYSVVSTELRKEAGACLVNLLKDEKVKKRPECRVLLERICSELLLCPDKETRKFLLDVLFKDQNLEQSLSIDQHTEHLSWLYRTQTLEVNRTTVSKNSSCFVNHGMFQKVKVKSYNYNYHLNRISAKHKETHKIYQRITIKHTGLTG